ncbi:MAG: hypothetical protein V4547_20480 [Bacteroidota bacterium]
MKTTAVRSITLLGIFFIFSTINAFGQKMDKAGTYLETIGKEFKQITDEMWDYTSAAAHGKKARTVENKRKELVSQITKSITKIKNMPGFEDNTSYRDSVVSYLKLNKLVLNEDYAKIVDMEEIAEQSYDAMETYMLAKERADDKLKDAGEMIEAEEKKFAADHNINLIEGKDKIGKKLAEAGKVYKYYNVIYLIFFKSNKQEVYLIDAQNKGDINAMEQNRNALANNSAEGKKKLAEIKDYKGDNSVKSACLEILNFYEKEAVKFTEITNYFIQKEKFEKIKTSFDAKSQSQRTKKDVDQFNAAVNEYNTASNKFNATNQELNQNRTKLLEKWNTVSEKLVDKFVPKKK